MTSFEGFTFGNFDPKYVHLTRRHPGKKLAKAWANCPKNPKPGNFGRDSLITTVWGNSQPAGIGRDEIGAEKFEVLVGQAFRHIGRATFLQLRLWRRGWKSMDLCPWY